MDSHYGKVDALRYPLLLLIMYHEYKEPGLVINEQHCYTGSDNGQIMKLCCGDRNNGQALTFTPVKIVRGL